MKRLKMLILTAIILPFFLNAGFYNDLTFYNNLLWFPHQIAISDFICTGTVISNVTVKTTVLAVDDVIWGGVSSSNITVRGVDEEAILNLTANSRYLICAFTNNWWAEKEIFHEDYCDASCRLFAEFLTPTNRPLGNAVFSDYRIMDSKSSVISFDKFNFNGTNYWNATRTFITNFLDIARIQHDEMKVFNKINTITKGSEFTDVLPNWLLIQLSMYGYSRYHGVEPGQPAATHPAGN